MAQRITESLYIPNGYLDANTEVRSIDELVEKISDASVFFGMSVHMPEAFRNAQGVPYPIDFWITPNGGSLKWEIKNVSSLNDDTDFELFKAFCGTFNVKCGYFPVPQNFEIIVAGEKYIFSIDGEGNPIWTKLQDNLDSIVDDAVEYAVGQITSGASDAFDTLKEVEDWINAHSADTSINYDKEISELSAVSHSHANKEILDSISSEDIDRWNNAVDTAFISAKTYTDGVIASSYTEVYESAISFTKQVVESAVTDIETDLSDYATVGFVASGLTGAIEESKKYTDEVVSAIEIPSGITSSITAISGSIETIISDVSSLSGAISETKSELETVKTSVSSVTEEISAITENVSEALATIEALSGISHTHENKDILDSIDELKINQWNSAEKNIINAISVNDEPLVVNDKKVNIDLSDYATHSYVTEQIVSAMTGGEVELVGYAKEEWVKSEDANAIESAKTYTDTKIGSALSPIDNSINELSGKSHSHANIDELNKISDRDIERWNTSQENVIESISVNNELLFVSDKNVNIDLSEYATIESEDVKFQSAYTAAVLSAQTYTDSLNHTHANKDILDNITETNIQNWDLAFESAHTHENKDVLDSISSDNITAWNNSETNAILSATTYADDKISEIVGTDTGKTIREIATEEIAVQLIPSGAQESLDTLQEIADWIQSHPDDAASMNSKIAELSGYTKALSAISHTHANKEILDAIDEEKVAKWDASETNVISAISVNNNPLIIIDKGVNIDLTDYATRSFVTEQIVSAMTGGEIELTGYAKEEWVKSELSNAVLSAQTMSNSAYTSSIASSKTYTDDAMNSAIEQMQELMYWEVGEDGGELE